MLIRLPGRDVDAIFAAGSGQQRVNELFRRAQRMRVSRTVVATVAMQDDYMKRVRGGGGWRDELRAEGIVIFRDYRGDQVLAAALGLPRPGPGSSSARAWCPGGPSPGTGSTPGPSGSARAPTRLLASARRPGRDRTGTSSLTTSPLHHGPLNGRSGRAQRDEMLALPAKKSGMLSALSKPRSRTDAGGGPGQGIRATAWRRAQCSRLSRIGEEI